jgi:hypothetical protein
MQEVRVHIPSNETDDENDSKSSSTDLQRDEEVWKEKNEAYFKNLKIECEHQSNLHDVASHNNKRKYIYTALPATVLPLLLANVSIFCDVKYVDTVGLTVIGVINGVQTLFNFSKKVAEHNIYAGKYMELSHEIDKILIRSKKFRESFDVVLERITMKKGDLDSNAPYL